MSVVRFLTDKANLKAFPHPAPSIKCLPKYFSKLQPKLNANPASSTVKRCVPFLDAMSQGYMIPLWCDMFVVAKNGDINIEFPPHLNMETSVSPHTYEQISDHPLSNLPYGRIPLKLHNPWIIKTDKNVSCLFTSPLNHMESRLKILDGVVDTDNYYNHINFPFLWTGGDGEFYLKKGTPIVHVIPFVRTEFTAEIGVVDPDEHEADKSIIGSVLQDAYRQNFWHKGEQIGKRDEM